MHGWSRRWSVPEQPRPVHGRRMAQRRWRRWRRRRRRRNRQHARRRRWHGTERRRRRAAESEMRQRRWRRQRRERRAAVFRETASPGRETWRHGRHRVRTIERYALSNRWRWLGRSWLPALLHADLARVHFLARRSLQRVQVDPSLDRVAASRLERWNTRQHAHRERTRRLLARLTRNWQAARQRSVARRAKIHVQIRNDGPTFQAIFEFPTQLLYEIPVTKHTNLHTCIASVGVSRRLFIDSIANLDVYLRSFALNETY